uniref:Small VCP interacting protein n=1 Tax=Anas platyrhynchos TaxID=8839 RepID=A0A8B9ZE72_ANAPL
MGLCLPCLGGAVKDVVETPDPEIKRRQLAEAAEKRQMEASSRGIKNTYSLEQKKKKQEEIEKRIAASGSGGEGGLRVSLKMKQYDATVFIFTKEKSNFVLLLSTRLNNARKKKNKRKGNGIEIEACVMYSQADLISGMQGWQRA